MEQWPVSLYEYEQYHQGQDIGNIDSGPFWKFNSGACVGFFTEVFPSPSDAAGAEQEVDQAAQREEIVAYEEVFKVQYVCACTHGGEAAPDVEAQYTW